MRRNWAINVYIVNKPVIIVVGDTIVAPYPPQVLAESRKRTMASDEMLMKVIMEQ